MRDGNPHFGATFAERKAARLGKVEPKQVKADDAEDKSIGASESKTRKPSRKGA